MLPPVGVTVHQLASEAMAQSAVEVTVTVVSKASYPDVTDCGVAVMVTCAGGGVGVSELLSEHELTNRGKTANNDVANSLFMG